MSVEKKEEAPLCISETPSSRFSLRGCEEEALQNIDSSL